MASEDSGPDLEPMQLDSPDSNAHAPLPSVPKSLRPTMSQPAFLTAYQGGGPNAGQLRLQLLQAKNKAQLDFQRQEVVINALRQKIEEQQEQLAKQAENLRIMQRAVRDYKGIDLEQHRLIQETSNTATAQIRNLNIKLRELEQTHQAALQAAQQQVERAKRDRAAVVVALTNIATEVAGGSEGSSSDMAEDQAKPAQELLIPSNIASWGRMQWDLNDQGDLVTPPNCTSDRDGIQAVANIIAKVLRLRKHRSKMHAEHKAVLQELSEANAMLSHIDEDFKLVGTVVTVMLQHMEVVLHHCGLASPAVDDDVLAGTPLKVSRRLQGVWQLLQHVAGTLLSLTRQSRQPQRQAEHSVHSTAASDGARMPASGAHHLSASSAQTLSHFQQQQAAQGGVQVLYDYDLLLHSLQRGDTAGQQVKRHGRAQLVAGKPRRPRKTPPGAHSQPAVEISSQLSESYSNFQNAADGAVAGSGEGGTTSATDMATENKAELSQTAGLGGQEAASDPHHHQQQQLVAEHDPGGSPVEAIVAAGQLTGAQPAATDLQTEASSASVKNPALEGPRAILYMFSSNSLDAGTITATDGDASAVTTASVAVEAPALATASLAGEATTPAAVDGAHMPVPTDTNPDPAVERPATAAAAGMPNKAAVVEACAVVPASTTEHSAVGDDAASAAAEAVTSAAADEESAMASATASANGVVITAAATSKAAADETVNTAAAEVVTITAAADGVPATSMAGATAADGLPMHAAAPEGDPAVDTQAEMVAEFASGAQVAVEAEPAAHDSGSVKLSGCGPTNPTNNHRQEQRKGEADVPPDHTKADVPHDHTEAVAVLEAMGEATGATADAASGTGLVVNTNSGEQEGQQENPGSASDAATLTAIAPAAGTAEVVEKGPDSASDESADAPAAGAVPVAGTQLPAVAMEAELVADNHSAQADKAQQLEVTSTDDDAGENTHTTKDVTQQEGSKDASSDGAAASISAIPAGSAAVSNGVLSSISMAAGEAAAGEAAVGEAAAAASNGERSAAADSPSTQEAVAEAVTAIIKGSVAGHDGMATAGGDDDSYELGPADASSTLADPALAAAASQQPALDTHPASLSSGTAATDNSAADSVAAEGADLSAGAGGDSHSMADDTVSAANSGGAADGPDGGTADDVGVESTDVEAADHSAAGLADERSSGVMPAAAGSASGTDGAADGECAVVGTAVVLVGTAAVADGAAAGDAGDGITAGVAASGATADADASFLQAMPAVTGAAGDTDASRTGDTGSAGTGEAVDEPASQVMGTSATAEASDMQPYVADSTAASATASEVQAEGTGSMSGNTEAAADSTANTSATSSNGRSGNLGLAVENEVEEPAADTLSVAGDSVDGTAPVSASGGTIPKESSESSTTPASEGSTQADTADTHTADAHSSTQSAASAGTLSADQEQPAAAPEDTASTTAHSSVTATTAAAVSVLAAADAAAVPKQGGTAGTAAAANAVEEQEDSTKAASTAASHSVPAAPELRARMLLRATSSRNRNTGGMSDVLPDAEPSMLAAAHIKKGVFGTAPLDLVAPTHAGHIQAALAQQQQLLGRKKERRKSCLSSGTASMVGSTSYSQPGYAETPAGLMGALNEEGTKGQAQQDGTGDAEPAQQANNAVYVARNGSETMEGDTQQADVLDSENDENSEGSATAGAGNTAAVADAAAAVTIPPTPEDSTGSFVVDAADVQSEDEQDAPAAQQPQPWLVNEHDAKGPESSAVSKSVKSGGSDLYRAMLLRATDRSMTSAKPALNPDEGDHMSSMRMAAAHLKKGILGTKPLDLLASTNASQLDDAVTQQQQGIGHRKDRRRSCLSSATSAAGIASMPSYSDSTHLNGDVDGLSHENSMVDNNDPVDVF